MIWRRSLSLKLTALFLALALGLALTFNFGLRSALGSGFRQLIQPLVSDYVDRLAAEIGSPPSVARAQALAERLPLSIRIDGPQLRWSSRGEAAEPPERDHSDWRWDHSPRAGAGQALTRRTADGHVLRFGLDGGAWLEQPRRIGWITLAGLLLLTGLAWWAAHRLLAPLRQIGAGVQRYGRGDFSQAIPARRRDELGELARRVNTMAQDLSGMLEGQRSLLLAVSHELRSPLTRARLNAELVAEGPERDALLRDLAEMRELIEQLLERERLRHPQQALQRVAVDLAALVQAQATAAGPAPLTLQLPPDLPPGQADPARLALLVRNLLDNARRHGGGSAIELQARLDAGELVLQVRDHGPGVPPELLARLGEPFYRPDPARQRATGGTGLGLSLCRGVVEAHGGSLVFDNAHPGLRATVRLPWPA